MFSPRDDRYEDSHARQMRTWIDMICETYTRREEATRRQNQACTEWVRSRSGSTKEEIKHLKLKMAEQETREASRKYHETVREFIDAYRPKPQDSKVECPLRECSEPKAKTKGSKGG